MTLRHLTVHHQSPRFTLKAGRPKAKRPSGATAQGNDPYVKAGESYKFYGKPDGKAVIFAPVWSLLLEAPDKECITCGYPPDVFWNTLAYRRYDASCALNCTALSGSRAVYPPRWMQKPRDLRRGDKVKVIFPSWRNDFDC